jgi:Uri superfamily endonuclease
MKTDVRSISELSTTGVYTLLIHASKEATLTVGKLGTQIFSEGYYTYTGSALGKGATGLKHRIARHLKKNKQKFWHIDYLLANQNVSIEAAVAAETAKKMECTINGYLKNLKGAKVPIYGFGASDCRKNCKSHLLYFPELKKADWLVQKLVLHLQSSTGILSVIVVD